MKKLLTALLCAGLLFSGLPGCTAPQSSSSSSSISTESASPPPAFSSEASSSAPEISSVPEPSSSEPEPEPEPPEPVVFQWETGLPEDHGIDPSALETLHTSLTGTGIYAVLTVRDGVIVDEYYQDGYSQESIFPLHSCSKSFTSTLIGLALEEGLIDSLDASIETWFPQLAGEPKGQITIRDLLMHKSGLEWHEWDGDSFFALNRSENWVDYVLSQPLFYEPGTVFSYTTGGTHLLAAILEQAAEGGMLKYAEEKLFTPLGMESVQWGTDPQGILDGGNGIRMTARNAARFGQLFLNNGLWEGERLVPEDWIAQATTIHEQRYGGSGSYGYQWWIRSFGQQGYDSFFAMGAFGQFIFVVPELSLVTVITANTSQFAPYPYFETILNACQAEY